MIELIADSWGWTGLQPVALESVNDFGNVLVRAIDGSVWRIMPEEPSCKRIAATVADFDSLRLDPVFQADWLMTPLVKAAAAKFGPLPPGRCYCLKTPAVVGGKYNIENMGTVTVSEAVAFAGDFARQINDLPDGTPIKFDVVD